MMALPIQKVKVMLSNILIYIAKFFRKLADLLDPPLLPEWYKLIPFARTAVVLAEKDYTQGPFRQLGAMRTVEKMSENFYGKVAPRRDINTAVDFAYREMVDGNRHSTKKKISSRNNRLAYPS